MKRRTTGIVALALLVVVFARAAPEAKKKQLPLTMKRLVKLGVHKKCRLAGRKLARDTDGDKKAEWLLNCTRANDEATEESHKDKECEEVYLLRTKKPSLLKLAGFCPQQRGARGLGGDEIGIVGNLLTQTRSGGSSWSWSRECNMTILPPRMISKSRLDYHVLAVGRDHSTKTDYRTGTTTVEFSLPICGDESAPNFRGKYRGIPVLELDKIPKLNPLVQHDRRCVLDLGTHGFVVPAKGNRRGKKDAGVQVWGFEDKKQLVLRILVRDDKFISAAKSWLATDHLELWIGRKDWADTLLECAPRKKARKGLVQFAIIPNGTNNLKVLLAFGKTTSRLVARVINLKRGRLFELVLDSTLSKLAREGMLSLTYSDGDDGRTQKYLLVSSKLTYADSRSLGELTTSKCRLKNGALHYKKPPSRCAAILY